MQTLWNKLKQVGDGLLKVKLDTDMRNFFYPRKKGDKEIKD